MKCHHEKLGKKRKATNDGEDEDKPKCSGKIMKK